MSDFEITHYLISMKRGETRGSKSPMWRCTTSDGESVNVFQHSDPGKDNARLFEGYLPDMLAMTLNQEITWKQQPIPVQMVKDGQWWEIKAVAPRQSDQQPDPTFIPERHLHRQAAQQQTNAILYNHRTIIFDVETTGLGKDDEIVSLAAISSQGVVLLNTLIQPRELGRVAATESVHRIKLDELVTAPTFEEIYPRIKHLFQDAIWVAYNATFDSTMLVQNCIRRGLIPPTPIGMIDAMEVTAWFLGDWNPVHQNYTALKLATAAEKLGIEVAISHDALADCQTTLSVLQHISWAEEVMK